MPAVNTLTDKLSPPRRPGIDDVGGGAKINDAEFPPDVQTMPTAEEDNQKSKQVVGIRAVLPVAILDVDFTAGTPSIIRAAVLNDAVVIGDFTLTDNGVGDTTIDWTAQTFPARVVDPVAMLRDTTTDSTVNCERVSSPNPGARVRTETAGTPADRNFQLWIFGD
jgi:hypothetical protein